MGNIFSLKSLIVAKTEQKNSCDNKTIDFDGKKFHQFVSESCTELRFKNNSKERQIEQGVHVTFIQPVPEFTIETYMKHITTKSQVKVFINVCYSDDIDKITCTFDGDNDYWSIFHTDFVLPTKVKDHFKHFVRDVALKSIEDNFNVFLDRSNLKYSKKCFNFIMKPIETRLKLHHLKSVQKPLVSSATSTRQDNFTQTVDLNDFKEKSVINTPVFEMNYCLGANIQTMNREIFSNISYSNPDEIIIEIVLPLLENSENIDLKILNNVLKLVSKNPACYKLNIDLPYTVSVEKCNGLFDTDTKKLVIRLPVLSNQSLKNDDGTNAIVTNWSEKSKIESTKKNNNIENSKKSESEINRNESLLKYIEKQNKDSGDKIVINYKENNLLGINIGSSEIVIESSESDTRLTKSYLENEPTKNSDTKTKTPYNFSTVSNSATKQGILKKNANYNDNLAKNIANIRLMGTYQEKSVRFHKNIEVKHFKYVLI
ncbi:protein kintoun-like [Daktulosphaira vitifoliae]|uniref:protein kintoun-like n=1 Tax=Daktulosphaira vitifoliae TaxID=58002 RepID=UPI0021AA5082|nr:protein kintoun-like [Daktulosphaira vitifoliae]